VKELRPPDRRQPAKLPALDELPGDGMTGPAQASLIQAVLRQTAIKHRNGHFQTFYSIRAVAHRFRVPHATVTRIYQNLSSQGLLRMVWGSKTLLEPAASSRRKHPPLIGLAVDVLQFGESISYRQLMMQMQREIWNHGALDRCMFFTASDELVPLCKPNRGEAIDTVIWLLPHTAHKQTLLRLHDMGIHVICLGQAPMSGINHCLIISPTPDFKRIVRQEILTGR
jgi:hypothetical protein